MNVPMPNALAGWRHVLQEFELPQRSALGSMLQVLTRWLPGDAAGDGTSGPPDGYGGVTSRGPLARLLASEWALFEAIPEEFLRRAIAGEQQFLAPAFRTHRESRDLTLLFDTGPAQLGMPRVVHLALLLLFAERAELRGTTLRWASLQSKNGLAEGVSKASIYELLQARTGTLAAPSDAVRWAREFADAAARRPASEVWIVTAPSTARELAGAFRQAAETDGATTTGGAHKLKCALHVSWLGVEEVSREVAPPPSTRPAVPQLRVEAQGPSVHAKGARPLELLLDAPPSDVAVALLRRPFASEKQKEVQWIRDARLDARKGVCLAPDGDYVLVPMRALDGTAAGVQIAPLRRAGRGERPPLGRLALPPGHTMVAATWTRKRARVVAVTPAPHRVYLHTFGRGSLFATAPAESQELRASPSPSGSIGQIALTNRSAVRPLGVRMGETGKLQVILVDDSTPPRALHFDASTGRLLHETERSFDLGRAIPGGMAFNLHDGIDERAIVQKWDTAPPTACPPPNWRPEPSFWDAVGRTGAPSNSQVLCGPGEFGCLLAIGEGTGFWHYAEGRFEGVVDAPFTQSLRPIAITTKTREGTRIFHVIAVDASGCEVSLVSLNTGYARTGFAPPALVVKTDAPVLHAYGGNFGLTCLVCADSTVLVLSGHEVVLRLSGGTE